MHDTLPLLNHTDFPSINRMPLEVLQVNMGYLCNMQCLHCHVAASPYRTEMMSAETVDAIIDFFTQTSIQTIDLTGGAPELNAYFRNLVTASRAAGITVIDRCNLTVLQEPGQEDTAEFLADNQVEVVASLPCYLQDNVDAQRGKGAYEGSITGLQKLNALGYGKPGTGLSLNLVYNPQGPVLPPPQEALEKDYKVFLAEHFDVHFNQLFTLANMPIQRFGSTLVSKGQFESYMDLLKSSHSDENLESVMCRNTISIDWQGYIYDCDFNQMLKLPAALNGQSKTHISALTDQSLVGQPIAIADHCYGCTAGQGSSCGGALTG